MAFAGFFSSVKRKLVGQRGEDLIYDGWACELQDDLRQLRDRRIGTDLDLGMYGDAHSELILACTNDEFLAKVKLLIDNLSDEEKIKLSVQVEVGQSDAPPMYAEATEDMTEEEKELLNKQAEKNLLDLQEKLRLLEEQLEREERSKLTNIAESPEETESAINENETTDEVTAEPEKASITEETPEETTENQNEETADAIVSTAESPANLEQEKALTEVTAEVEKVKEVDETSVEVICESAPVEPTVESETKQESSINGEDDKEDAELTKSIEAKEKEALQVANETIQYLESKKDTDLPPTYEETTSVPIAQIVINDMTPKPEAQIPTVAAICAFFYTGEIVVSKKNFEELREYGIKLNIDAFIKASEEFVNMMGPDTDEENDVGTMRYKFRDVGLTSHLVMTSFDAIYRLRRAAKPEELNDMDKTPFCLYRGEEIHQLLLSATCDMFREKVEVEIPAETDQVVLKQIIEFVYTGRIPGLMQTMGREVLIVAKRLGFVRLVTIMVDWLMNRIKADNCIELQLLGVDHEIKPLAERARHFVLRNFKDVSKTESFRELPGSWLCDYVDDDLVEVDFPADKGEFQLFQQCKKWADTHPVERVDEFADIIIRAIRFELISLKDLAQTISKDAMVLDNKMATNHIADIIEYKNQGQVPNGRLRGSEAVIIAGGSVPIIDDTKGGVYDGEDHHVYDSSILAFNPKTFSTHLIANIPEKVCLHQITIVGPCLYVAGGFDGFSCIVGDFFRLDMTNGKWTALPPLQIKRACFQMIALNNHLFALGGLTPQGFTQSVERYDLTTNEWEYAAPLSEPRYRHAACVTSRGKILLSGGITRERENGIEDVNEYNPDFDQWMTRTPMHKARDSHTMIPKGKKVYVIGGQEKSRAGVEVYSIELNQWTQLQTAPRIQYMAACGLANSKIFMIGGWITDSESLEVVAMYDYENDEWGEEGQLTLARGSADATVSKIPRSYWSNKFTFQAPKLIR